MTRAVVVAVGTRELPPVQGLRVMAFDPSLKCTGLALLDVLRDASIKVRRLGYIDGPPGDDLWQRVQAIQLAVMRFMDECGDVGCTVVEMPMTKMGGVEGGRNRATLPGYGVCVGAVASMVSRHREVRWRYFPSASDWSSGLKTGGKGKPERIATVAVLTGLSLNKEFTRARAENVADAVLLARWGGLKAMEDMV